jgi:membrane protein DedA with SNARE-associated domain
MYEVLKSTHSGLRWIALLMLVVAIVNSAMKMKSNKFEKGDKMLGLFGMVFLHLQICVGLVLLFISPKVSYAAGWMKFTPTRFFGMEHILLMVVAVVLATIGYSKSKKKEDLNKKHKTIFVWYLIALILVLAAIPWPFRTELGGSWF